MIAFILGLLIGYLISWFLHKKQVDVSEERIAEPSVDKPARERDLTDDAKARADADVDVDAKADAGDGGLGVAAGGAAVGAGAGFLAGKSGDGKDTGADVDTPALAADADRTEYIAAPSADAPSVDADVDTPSADVDAPTADADVDTPSVGTPSVDAPSEPALSMIGDKDSGIEGGSAAPAGVTEAAYGSASALPLAGGAAPSDEFTVKGNEDSMLYHTPESPYYSRTKAEVWFKTPADAEAAGFTAWNRPKAGASGNGDAAQAAVSAPEPVVEPGAYAGSAKPLAGGAAPSAEYTVKGNEDSMLYHTPESAFYEHTGAEVWFKSAADAQAAGFTAWNQVRTDPTSAGAAAGAAADEADTGRIPVQSAEGAASAAAAGTATATSTAPAVSPYGPGSALPLDGGAAPSEEYTVKGNADSMLYHTTESPYFPRTVAEVWFKTPADAQAAGFTAWNERRAQSAVAEPSWEPGSYPESAKPLADGSAPAPEFTVKGNEDSMLFHTTESPYYPRTRAEVWFRTAADAEAAGFTAWNRRR